MRKVARTMRADDGVKRVMLYESENGTYLFGYRILGDGSCSFDEWYVTTAEAEAACRQRYGITDRMWQVIGDPLEGCQHDWIAPVRVKGRDTGRPVWGVLEGCENGIWKEVRQPEDDS